MMPNEVGFKQKDKEESIARLNRNWKEKIDTELISGRNLKHLLTFTEETVAFLKEIIIKDIAWLGNYHSNPHADCKIEVIFGNVSVMLTGQYGKYLIIAAATDNETGKPISRRMDSVLQLLEEQDEMAVWLADIDLAKNLTEVDNVRWQVAQIKTK